MEQIPAIQPVFGDEEAQACLEYMKSGGYVTEFRKTRELEKMISKYTGAKHCFMVPNGTVSLILALVAVGVGVGDEVIVPNLTMVATANAVKIIGATPVFLDVEPSTLTLDPTDVIKKTNQKINQKTNQKTKAIMQVSLNTRCYQLEELREYCDQNNLYLIEDSAQSLGSFYRGKAVGTIGHIGSYSFSSPKIISMGQGGALVTNDDYLASQIKYLKDFGRDKGGGHNFIEFGINCKYTDLQAVVGIEQMKKLPARVSRKKEMWRLYYQLLSKIPEVKMLPSNDPGWIPWVIDIYVEKSDELVNYLKEHQIDTRRQYPPLNSIKIYRESQDETFPISDKFSKQGIWLPFTHTVTDEQIVYICQIILNFFQS